MARVVVTRRGCWQVRSFEGCEAHDVRKQPDARSVNHLKGWLHRGDRPRKHIEAQAGSGAQQTRKPPAGGSRRGGAKPRGRNANSRLAPAVRTKSDSSRFGEWTAEGEVGRGRHEAKPKCGGAMAPGHGEHAVGDVKTSGRKVRVFGF